MKTAAPVAAKRSDSEGAGARPFFSRPAAVQTKLRVGKSGDRFEREADAAADGVVHGRGTFARSGAIAPRLTPTVQRR
jgi:hypothetical protein